MKNTPYVLVPAKFSDIEDIMNIEKDAFAKSVAEERSSFCERLQVFPQGFLLLKVGTDTAGYFCGELWSSETAKPYSPLLFTLGHSAKKLHKPDGTIFYISSMGILSAYRGRGLGGYLFNASINYVAKKMPFITAAVLLVNETWSPARSLYRKAGFWETQIFPGFFTGNSINEKQNGIIMEKNFHR